ncbi:hypothetical protein MTP99_012954 [Tenebrio molitor]|nr:hypothetical protein MTP99_012954 [Tenebrio molitor]
MSRMTLRSENSRKVERKPPSRMAPSHDSRAPSSNASDSRASGSTERSNRRTPSRGSSNVQALNRPNSSTPKPTLYKYTIKNIPEEFATQKKIYNLLTTHLVTRNIHKSIVNWNRTALLIISLPIDDKFTAQLNSATGSRNITCAPINQKTANNPNSDNPRKKPQFSVDIDIDENDISQTFASLELLFVRLWRIKSRQTNKFTKLIRVITEDTVTVVFLLNNGINLFGNHHQCELSKPPEPTPLQCTKCYQLGHPATACTNKPACPKCPETHAPNNCEAATPKCLHCGGAHAASSRKCPKIKDAPITEETPITPTYVINPSVEFADPEVLIDESAEFKINTKQTFVFVTKILYDLFPLQRPKIHELVELASR